LTSNSHGQSLGDNPDKPWKLRATLEELRVQLIDNCQPAVSLSHAAPLHTQEDKPLSRLADSTSLLPR
jgi:hypothetical protein